MDTKYPPALRVMFGQLLARREAELRLQLGAFTAHADADCEVHDFKELAMQESAAVLRQAQAGQAAQELAEVLMARRRMHEGRYGECVDCGEAIAPRRLLALPATRYCTGCQARAEARRLAPPPPAAPGASRQAAPLRHAVRQVAP